MKTNITVTFICLTLLIPSVIKADSTVIYNSVSVSANSGNKGESSASVKTIHNGEVIEEFHISTSTDFTYQSEYTVNGGDVENPVEQTQIKYDELPSPTKNRTQQLTLLLNNLLTLLDYYEKLLDKHKQ